MNKEMYSTPHIGICPHCKAVVKGVIAEEVAAAPTEETSAIWRAMSFSCSECKTVLSVQMEPQTLRADIIGRVEQALKDSEGREGRARKELTLAIHRMGLQLEDLKEQMVKSNQPK